MMDIDPTKALQAAVRIGMEEAQAQAKEEIEKLRAALRSIAANTCCDRCQEAALVARAALGKNK